MEQPSSASLLLTTKLTIPPVRSGYVARPRLFEKLAEAKEQPLTLLAAPAGFGKTLLLSAWARQQPVAWLSLDSSDNDPAQFWMYVLAALDTVQPGIGQAPLSLLQSEQSIEAVLATLLNALGTLPQDIVLALDDYHVIDALPIQRAMTFLLDHLPPQFHVIIASRVDPPLTLARLRARHQLVELRIDDLRFTFEEAATFLRDVMDLRLTAGEVAALEARTEGWIAGLQLAALSMQGRDDAASFVAAFAGSHRYIVDYLTEEVLRQQAEHTRMFLLQTSILERLNGSLCDAVTEQQSGQATLERLEQANLFLLPLDDERRWYRYHHLFAEALRFRLSRTYADLLPTLHTRASLWFEQQGLLPEAVDHAFAARDYERAATLIEPILYPMFNRGTHATVRRWLQALPEEVLYARPSLCLLYAWAFMYVGELASCERPLAAAEHTWQAEGNTRGLSEVYTFRTSVALVLSDAQRARDYTQRALALLPEDDLVNRCNCAVYLGGSAFLLGEVREASRQLNEARALCQKCHLYSTLYAMNFLADAEIVQGRLHHAAAISQEVMSSLNGRQSIHSSWAQSRLGGLYCEWNELDMAEQAVRQGVKLGEQAGQGIYMAPIYLLAAQVLWVRGEMEDALEVLAKAERAAQQLGDHHALEHVHAFRARLALARDDLAQAEQWSAKTIAASAVPAYEHEVAYLMLARLHLARHRTGEAVELLERMHAADEAAGREGNVISVLALLALAHWQAERSEQATRVLDRVLALAEPEGYIRVFVDEGAPMRDLLAAWLKSSARQPTTNASPLIEPLSTREQDVLELLAAGLSNAEMAAQLVVTVGTIKTHIKSIYGKLGVHSRTQAVARAREAGLL